MSEMEESDSSQQKKCPCGFWGSTKTQGLCSKCFKEHTEKAKDSLDPKAELMKDRPRQPQFGGCDSLGPGPSSYAPSSLMSSSGRQPNTKPFEKAEELLRNAMKQSGVELSINTNKNSNSNPNADSSSDKKKDVSSESTSNKDKTDSVKDEKVSSSSNESCGSGGSPNGEKRGIKRDSSALDIEETSTPESTPEKVGQKSKKKCGVCKCKLELAQRAIGKCRCENVYCSLHRLPEQHQCTFDHKEDGRREAREKMIKPTRHLGTSFKRLDSDS